MVVYSNFLPPYKGLISSSFCGAVTTILSMTMKSFLFTKRNILNPSLWTLFFPLFLWLQLRLVLGYSRNRRLCGKTAWSTPTTFHFEIQNLHTSRKHDNTKFLEDFIVIILFNRVLCQELVGFWKLSQEQFVHGGGKCSQAICNVCNCPNSAS